MKLWTRTNYYVEVIVDGKLIRADIIGTGYNACFIINGEAYLVRNLEQSCIVDGCDKESNGTGYCDKHFKEDYSI